MAALNHFIGAILAPVPIGLLMLVLGLASALWKRDGRIRKTAWGLVAFACVWMWFCSTGLAVMMLGRPLENLYPPCADATLAQGDAIVLLGGGMGWNENLGASGHSEMWGSADRVWRAAQLWKAGKASVIYASGGAVFNSVGELLLDFGVPTNAVVFVDEPRNTEEEAKFVSERIASVRSRDASSAAAAHRCGGGGADTPRIVLVTSAWHMRRAELMFRKEMGDAVDIIPVGCDYETLTRFDSSGWPHLADLWPTADNLAICSFLVKEHYAYWAYKIFRGF